MLTLPPSVRVYVATAPCDMRKQFDGIATLVEHGPPWSALQPERTDGAVCS